MVTHQLSPTVAAIQFDFQAFSPLFSRDENTNQRCIQQKLKPATLAVTANQFK